MLKRLQKEITTLKDEAIYLQTEMTKRPALDPKSGGHGEKEKADFLLTYLRKIGISDITEIKIKDKNAPCGYRPNIAAKISGKNSQKTLWVVSHMDIVPPGDLTLWHTDPYQVVIDGDILTGRGVEDNQHGLTASLLAANAIQKLSVQPTINFGLLFVADEETGNTFGIHALLEERPELFKKDDLFLVPDYGESTSDKIEIAEKGPLWLKVTVNGKQSHASTPNEGINSLRAASAFILKIDELHTIFDRKNDLFSPPISTFAPTRKEENVPNINTIPGKDVFYIDCRILPGYTLNEVENAVKDMAKHIENEYRVKINVETVQSEHPAPVTSQKNEIITRLQKAIANVYNVKAEPIGIGGGTVAAALRKKGFSTAVWATLLGNAHQANEKTSLKNILSDAQVIVQLVCTPE